MNEEDIYEAFASAAQENYQPKTRTTANNQKTQSVGLFNFSASNSNSGS